MKKRVDEVLFSRGYFPSRSRARDGVLSGIVKVNGKIISKAGKTIEENSEIEINGNVYVSRGAYKLIKGLDEFKIDLSGKVCCDLGSSTGGFTQVMLERGARCIYAVDVGEGLKIDDPRIVKMEKTNARFLKKSDFQLSIDFVSCDLSFISLKYILPVIKEILSEDGISVCLVKPQFESGVKGIKNGIVRSKVIHLQVLKDILNFAQNEGFKIGGLTFSPIKGGSGNIEFLMELNKHYDGSFDVDKVVDSAWIELEE